MRNRWWLLSSLGLLFVSAFFWRAAEARRAETARAAAAQQAAAKPAGPLPGRDPFFRLPGLRRSVTASPIQINPVLPEDKRHPYRLRNTALPLENLLRSDSAVLLRNALVETTDKTPLAIPGRLRAQGDPHAYIVQARGNIGQAFRRQIVEAGGAILPNGYVPNNGLLVDIDAGGASKLANTPLVAAVLPFEPYYKLDRKLLEMAVTGQALGAGAKVNVTLFPGRREAALNRLAAMGAEMVAEQPTPFGPQLTLNIRPDSLVSLAQIPEVQEIERVLPRVFLTDLAKETMGVSIPTTNTVSYLNLTGAGVLMGFVDSGVQANHTDLSPQVLTTAPGFPLAITDTNGHGTEVAGVIIASGVTAPSGTNVSGSALGASFRGFAPSAQLLSLPTLSLPATTNIYSDPELQQFVSRTNILISNNSWGYLNPVYDTAAAQYDAAVRDSDPYRTNSQPILYVFAAGNIGFGQDNGIGGDTDTILSPATAKNVITVSAVEQFRNITNQLLVTNVVFIGTNSVTNLTTFDLLSVTDSRNQVADYASRGNVSPGLEGTFGRFKPDLVAPGSFVVTTTINAPPTNFNPVMEIVNSNMYSSLPRQYRYALGTSIAAAAVSGTLALMQEFFEQRLIQTNSPALYKALLINGARSVGNDVYDFCPTNSVNDQGWGLVNITNTLPSVMTNGLATSSTWPIIYFDQSATNGLATGESHSWSLVFTNPPFGSTQPNPTNFPLRITLVYTDPPGNPIVGTKLVNNLDLVVFDPSTSNYFFGNSIPLTREFNEPVNFTELFNPTNLPALSPIPELEISERNPVIRTGGVPSDQVNNVENVFIDAPLSTNLIISVVARKVNVNAVSQNTNAVVQDYALVISSGRTTLTNCFLISAQTNTFTNRTAKVVQNGVPLIHERVGANFQLFNPTNGVTNQWNFYVFTNRTASAITNTVTNVVNGTTNVITTVSNTNALPTGTNIAFITFRPPNLSRRRFSEADIDMFVSTNATLTNLLATTINATNQTFRSVSRGGTEMVLLTNNVTTNDVYYIGIKSEDQQSAEYGFIVLSTDSFGQNTNGGFLMRGFPMPAAIPDGTPEEPEGIDVFFIAADPNSLPLNRLGMTNNYDHENFGDLVGILSHNGVEVVLNNHSLNNGTNSGSVTNIYDTRFAGYAPDGPGTLLDFIGTDGQGLWILTLQDNAPTHIGGLTNSLLHLFPQASTNGASGTLAPGENAFFFVDIPPLATNLVVTVTNITADLILGVVKSFPPSTNYPGGFDEVTTIFATGGSLTNDLTDSPPLSPGRYLINLFNTNNTTTTYDISWVVGIGNSKAGLGLNSSGITNILVLDDAVTTNAINITTNRIITGVTVGLAIQHPRVTDLAVRLISPKGTSSLLYEDRGGMTNGSSATNLYANFTEDTNTTTFPLDHLIPIKFATPPLTNIISPPQLLYSNFFGPTNLYGNSGTNTLLASNIFFWTTNRSRIWTNATGVGAALAANGLIVVGNIGSNYTDGFLLRYDMPMLSSNQPIIKTNWPVRARNSVFFAQNSDSIRSLRRLDLPNRGTIEAVILIPSTTNQNITLNNSNTRGTVFVEQTGAEQKLLSVGPNGFGGGLSGVMPGGTNFYVDIPITFDQWHHIAYTYDGAWSRYYLDGLLVGSQVTSGGNVVNGAATHTHIGQLDNGTDFLRGFVGFVDSVRVSQNARYTNEFFLAPDGDLRTDNQTLLLYNFNDLPQTNNSPPIPPNPPFIRNPTVRDSSGNNNHGDLLPVFTSGTYPYLATDTNGVIVEFNKLDAFTGAIATDEGLYLVGHTTTFATNATNTAGIDSGVPTQKGMVLKYAFDLATGGARNGSIWRSQVVTTNLLPTNMFVTNMTLTNFSVTPFPRFESTNVLNAVTSALEGGTNYIYATGYAPANASNIGRFFLEKLANIAVTNIYTNVYTNILGGGPPFPAQTNRTTNVSVQGVVLWTTTNGPATNTAFSSGNAIGVIVSTNYTNIVVAGVTNDGTLLGAPYPTLAIYSTNGVLLWETVSTIRGQYNGIAISGTNVYAVGQTFTNNATGSTGCDALIERWGIHPGNGTNNVLVWQRTYDLPKVSPAIASSNDILYAAVAIDDRLYAVGSTEYSTVETNVLQTNRWKEAVLLEIDGATGTNYSMTNGILSTNYYVSGISNDVARAVITDGRDLYVVGDTYQAFSNGVYTNFTSTNNLLIATNMTNQHILVLRYRVRNFYLPEEPLSSFNGESTLGPWTLEITDTRAGPTPPPTLPVLVSWNLDFNYAPTNIVPAPLVPGAPPLRFPLGGAQRAYFSVTVPSATTVMTNTLSADANIRIIYNSDRVPIPTALGNRVLSSSTTGGSFPIVVNGDPALVPGRTYYLGVENASLTGTNNVNISVQADRTNGTPQIPELVNGSTATFVNASPGSMSYYQFTVPDNATAASFELFSLTANADLYLRKAQAVASPFPSTTSFDYRSVTAGRHAEQIWVTSSGTSPTLTPGVWYLGVHNNDVQTVVFNVRATAVTGLPFTEVLITTNGSFTGMAAAGNAPNYMFRFNVPSPIGAILFEMDNVSGDPSLVLRRSTYPSASTYDMSGSRAGSVPEFIALRTNSLPGVSVLTGTWYLSVINALPSTADFSVRASYPSSGGLLISAAPLALPAAPTISTNRDVKATVDVISGEKYQVQYSTDLVHWTILTNIIAPAGGQIQFTDPAALTNQLRVYRVLQVAQ